ncbi:MAG TPA: hypothetical protein VF021_10470, partial [Longimicrobiales bacterium]
MLAAPQRNATNQAEILGYDCVFSPILDKSVTACARTVIAQCRLIFHSLQRRRELLSVTEQEAAAGALNDFRERSDASCDDRRALAKCLNQNDAKG